MIGKRRSKLKDKRGGIFDIFIFIAVTIVIVMFCGLFLYGWGQFYDTLETVDLNVGRINFTEITQDTLGEVDTAFQSLRLWAMAIIISLIITVFVSNFFVKAHPVVIVVYIFIGILAVILSVPISNMYESLLTGFDFSATLQSFTWATWVLLNFPAVVTAVALLGLLFLVVRSVVPLGSEQNAGEVI